MTVLLAMAAFAAGFVVGALVVNAPEGYQDDEGFHYGIDPHTAAIAAGLTPQEIQAIETRRTFDAFGG